MNNGSAIQQVAIQQIVNDFEKFCLCINPNTRGNHHARYENTDNTPVSQSTSDDVPPPPPSAGAEQGSDITAHSADTSNTQGRKILIDSANNIACDCIKFVIRHYPA